MSSIAGKSNAMNRIKIALMVFGLLLNYPIFAIAYSDTNLASNPSFESSTSFGATIAYLGDARPSKFGTAGITELTRDFNQVIPQSPTGMVDAIIMIGDMDKISQTKTAYNASNVTNIPIFYVMGNHEVETSDDVTAVRAMFSNSTIPLTPGPAGTDKTTYSFDVGEIHVINMNEYWNGASNDAWFKYGNGDGGYIPDALYNWISNDLSKTIQPWKIVVGHEPLYPRSRHVGDSLDKDPANRNKLQNLFVSQNVAVFVGAHTHYATVNEVGGVYHLDAGVSGQKPVDGEDPYASIIYTHIDEANNLILTWKHENPTWDTPVATSYTISKVNSSSTIPPTPQYMQNTIGNYWVNHSWQAGTGFVTDAYNISVNGVWHNGTNQYYNDSVGASNWSDIIVWAWNNSGSGNMSILSVSQNIKAPSLPINSPVNITSYAPFSPINDNVGATRTFMLTVNQTVDIKWYINGTQVSSNSSVTAGNYTNTSAKLGTWNVSAIVDNSNGSVVKTWIWKVSDLIANAGGPYTGTPGVLINFTGSASGGAAPYSYSWSFGDGKTSNLENPVHAYSNKGSYTAPLTVTDSMGRTSSPDTAAVSVESVRFMNGTVMDSVNKAGLAGVMVFTNTTLSTMTNATGFYSFSLNSGTYNITATFEPAYYPNSTTVSLMSAVVVQDIELLKKQNGIITGWVSNT